MNLIFLGAPGAGKGTIAQHVVEDLGIIQISTGDLLRAAVKEGTELGIKAKGYMDKGELVTDELVIGLLKERITKDDCKNGFILDGFPRTPAQAEALDNMLAEFDGRVDVVPFILVKDVFLIERLSNRWTCRDHGHIFNEKFNPPAVEGVCDVDGSELYQRDDDKPETIKNEYRDQSSNFKFYTC